MKNQKLNLKNIRSAHKTLAEYSYREGEVVKGFANRILFIDVSKNVIIEKKVTEYLKKKFKCLKKKFNTKLVKSTFH